MRLVSVGQSDVATANIVRVALGRYPYLDGFRRTPPDLGNFEIYFDNSFDPVHKAFRPMAEEQRFDVSEMAIATYLQARAAGKPITLLPVTVMGRFQHDQLLVAASSALTRPRDLQGKRIGVRSYSQTTGLWVRAFLHSQYQVDLDSITWVVFEEAHVRGFDVPSNVAMAGAGKTLLGMLRDGEVDAVIEGAGAGQEARPLLADPVAAARDWYEMTHIVTANHVLTVTERLLDDQPDVVRRIYDAVRGLVGERNAELARIAGDDPQWAWARSLDRLPTGRQLTEVVAAAARQVSEQRLIPGSLSEPDLTHPTVRGWL